MSGQFLNPKVGNKSKVKNIKSKNCDQVRLQNLQNFKYQILKSNMLSQTGIEERIKLMEHAPSYLRYFEFIPLRVI